MAERIAAWRADPQAERALVAERGRWRKRACALVALGVLDRVLPDSALGIVVAGLGALGFVALTTSARTVEASRDYQDGLREAHAAVGGRLVEMTVRQGEATTGMDHGVVWTEDGRLFFAGARTPFGLAAPGDRRRLGAG